MPGPVPEPGLPRLGSSPFGSSSVCQHFVAMPCWWSWGQKMVCGSEEAEGRSGEHVGW